MPRIALWMREKIAHESDMFNIEVSANDYRPLGASTFEAFFDAVGNYLALEEVATLGGFLSWLREAEQREDLSPRPEDPEPGTVQVLTIHGAKGLEWDHVVVPRLVDDELPRLEHDQPHDECGHCRHSDAGEQAAAGTGGAGCVLVLGHAPMKPRRRSRARGQDITDRG